MPHQREPARLPERPPFVQSKLERRTIGRAQPPPPPTSGDKKQPERAVKSPPPVNSKAQTQKRRQQIGSLPQETPQPQISQPKTSPAQPSAPQTSRSRTPKTLPGEPANRLSPNRSMTVIPQRVERKASPAHPRSEPGKAQQERPGPNKQQMNRGR
jgi:hypothetical protein